MGNLTLVLHPKLSPASIAWGALPLSLVQAAAQRATLHVQPHCTSSHTAHPATLHIQLLCTSSHIAHPATLRDQPCSMSDHAAHCALLHTLPCCTPFHTAHPVALAQLYPLQASVKKTISSLRSAQPHRGFSFPPLCTALAELELGESWLGPGWGSPLCSDPQQGRGREEGGLPSPPSAATARGKIPAWVARIWPVPMGPAGAASSRLGISTWQKLGHFTVWFYL